MEDRLRAFGPAFLQWGGQVHQEGQHSEEQSKAEKMLKQVQHRQFYSLTMESNYSFAGMTLTEIFQIQGLQSLFIKFWYLGLSAEGAPEDAALLRAIRKGLTFANCFSFQMPLRSYIQFTETILAAVEAIRPRGTFQILLGHLRNNKVLSVSFQLFGVAFLQLFGRLLELLNTQTMAKILRKLFVQITVIAREGTSQLKTKGIRPIRFEQLLPNFQELLQQTEAPAGRPNPEQVSLGLGGGREERDYDMKTLKGRFEGLREVRAEQRQGGGEHYPPGERARSRDKASISCFMMGGFEIVDYSQSINQLHKKLLTKILLNK